MRHTLASSMLEKDVPLSIISDILGHTDAKSTAIYLRTDLKGLKECALDLVGIVKND